MQFAAVSGLQTLRTLDIRWQMTPACPLEVLICQANGPERRTVSAKIKRQLAAANARIWPWIWSCSRGMRSGDLLVKPVT